MTRADVIVLGSGIIGLTAAVRLTEAGADVRVWSPIDPRDTVSAVAAAVWYPARTAFDPRVRDWCRATHEEFTRQAAAGVPGLSLHPTRNVGVVRELPWWAPPDATAGEDGVRFIAPLAEMDAYLPWLAHRVRIERRGVDRITDALAEASVVVNATGLAAGELCGDDAVYPARGQIVLVRNPGLVESVRMPDTYVHPRTHDVVLGGTFEEGVSDLSVNPRTRKLILERCTALVPELAGAEVLGDRVGLRPCRRGGPRVEREGAVVHAYGHGGAGMTLSWGCADEITRLVTG